MFRNYIQVALRNLRRRRVYTLINIIGLSTGLACALFIYNWVKDELSYDKHFPKGEQIYRVVAEAGVGEDRWHQTVTSLPLGTTMTSTFPEVKAAVRLDKNDAIVKHGDKSFVEEYLVFTDPSFFEIFDYHLTVGNERTALAKPYQVVLTETMARKYFGDIDPIGKTLKIFQYDPDGRGMDYEVTGVIKDAPETSHFTFNMLCSLNTLESIAEDEFQNWGNNGYHTYVLLAPGTDPAGLESKLPQMIEQHAGEMLKEYNLYYRFYLQPVQSIHLHSDLMYEFKANGNISYIWIFSAIGILILALAVINYINLATAFSLERARETGVRKVLGAFRSQIVLQHMTETLVLTLFSILAAGLLIEVFKPFFHQISGKPHIQFNRLDLLFQLMILCIPVGFAAGYFPARNLSVKHTLVSLKGEKGRDSKVNLRMALVTFQFIVTLVMLVGLVIISQQMKFIQSRDLGYDSDNLMVLRVNGDETVKAGYEAFKNDLKQESDITQVARSGGMIISGLGNSNGQVKHENGEVQFEKLYRLSVGYDYLETYGMQLTAGRNFSRSVLSDSTEAFIINEIAAKAYGWSEEEAIGKEISYAGRSGRIIGVVKNFHFNSLRHEIQPVCLFIQPNFSRISVKGENSREVFAQVEKLWKSHFPDAIFDYTFQDQALFDSYYDEQRLSYIINIFSVISIVIAFLGLFGLVGYTVSRKTKEIGIRKVLGATTGEIILLISNDFIRLVAVAAVIAFPLGWWVMNQWLENFPYRIEMQVWFFIVAGATLLSIALAIVFLQTIKASRANPVEALKEE